MHLFHLLEYLYILQMDLKVLISFVFLILEIQLLFLIEVLVFQIKVFYLLFYLIIYLYYSMHFYNHEYKIELLNNYNENININSNNYIEKVINKGETCNVNISLLIFELDQQNYVLEFVLKDEKGNIVENSKATFNLNIENENENSFEKIKEEDNQINEFNDLISDEDIVQIYNELNDDINIENIINLESFKIKLNGVLKEQKDYYKEMEKEERISELKDKMMDLFL